MKVVLLRVGIDSGSGGMQGPLFKDGSFEFICIPDKKRVDKRTYGNTIGLKGRPHSDYFRSSRRQDIFSQSIHVDPEFDTFTYGDPTPPKGKLRTLTAGDLLIFYAGLEGYDFQSPPALYLVGYFEVIAAGMASDFPDDVLQRDFSANFHVRHPPIFAMQKDQLVLVKGGPGSRLLKKAVCISEMGTDRDHKPLKILSSSMQQIFGDFDGKTSIQRSPPRWVYPEFTARAAAFIRSLP